MRAMIFCSLHYRQPGRDVILGLITDIWWPKGRREAIDQARLACKNFNCVSRQNQSGKVPEVKESKDEIALHLAGAFQNAEKE